MVSTGIDATIKQLVEQQVPKSTLGASGIDAAGFQALMEPIVAKLSEAFEAAVAKAAAAQAAPSGNATQPLAANALRADARLSPSALALLRNPSGQMFEQLSNDLVAGDPQYNQRETQMRDQLDLGVIEARLQEAARNMGVAYDRSDLEGVLRNAGYDAAHLGSSERYMAAIQKFMGEAENNYRQRSTNTPNQNA